MKVIVTGGCGFIGSALVKRLLNDGHTVLNIDAMTYAGDARNLSENEADPNYQFSRTDITDSAAVNSIFEQFQPDQVFHLAAESHVDRSIDGPSAFIQTNITGTFVMLDAAMKQQEKNSQFKFLHVSTDEVYGSLGETGYFTETTPYAPNSPYAASKAAADHLVRAWVKTYGLTAYISNCSNNYGPRQNAEKLIPTIIRNALTLKPIPIYGTGQNVRDWLHVDDHVSAMLTITELGKVGEKYNIGGDNELTNLSIAHIICDLLDGKSPRKDGASHRELIEFVTDRPGHDHRYAIDPSKVRKELNWSPKYQFDTGISETLDWYLAHEDYWRLPENSVQRLGLNLNKK